MLKQCLKLMQITVLTKKNVHRIYFIEQRTYHDLRCIEHLYFKIKPISENKVSQKCKILCVLERTPTRKRLRPNQHL